MPENVIYILIGFLVALFVYLILLFGRKLLKGQSIEIKARRLDLMDEKEARIAVSFSNLITKAILIKDFSFHYVYEDVDHPYGSLKIEPFVEMGNPSISFSKAKDGTFSISVSPKTRLDAIYSFSFKGENLPEGAKLFLTYLDERGNRFYSEFALDSIQGQLLRFKKRKYKNETKWWS